VGGFPLPAFVASVIARRPAPPRHIPVASVASVVLRGADCSIYAGAGIFFAIVGLFAVVTDGGVPGPGVSQTAIGEGLIALGLLCLSLASFRIWRVTSVLNAGEAHLAEVMTAAVGRARIYGTPWGEPLMMSPMTPIAARGTYRIVETGESGAYYMQQSWALGLRPGDRIWVLRSNHRDVLYAPGAVAPVPAPAIT